MTSHNWRYELGVREIHTEYVSIILISIPSRIPAVGLLFHPYHHCHHWHHYHYCYPTQIIGQVLALLLYESVHSSPSFLEERLLYPILELTKRWMWDTVRSLVTNLTHSLIPGSLCCCEQPLPHTPAAMTWVALVFLLYRERVNCFCNQWSKYTSSLVISDMHL